MIQNFQLTWTNNFFFTRFLICKKKRTLLYCLVETHARGYCHDTRITLTAQAKRIGALGTRIKIDITVFLLIRSWSFRVKFRTTSVASNLQTNLFIAARCVSFSTSLFFLTYWFLYFGATQTIPARWEKDIFMYLFPLRDLKSQMFSYISLFLSNRFTNTWNIMLEQGPRQSNGYIISLRNFFKPLQALHY